MTTALERARAVVNDWPWRKRNGDPGGLTAAIAAALEAYGAETRAAGVREAAHAALKARYGAPSSWGGDRPNGWTHRSTPPTPEEAAQHDNGCVDAFKAILSLAEARTEEGP